MAPARAAGGGTRCAAAWRSRLSERRSRRAQPPSAAVPAITAVSSRRPWTLAIGSEVASGRRASSSLDLRASAPASIMARSRASIRALTVALVARARTRHPGRESQALPRIGLPIACSERPEPRSTSSARKYPLHVPWLQPAEPSQGRTLRDGRAASPAAPAAIARSSVRNAPGTSGIGRQAMQQSVQIEPRAAGDDRRPVLVSRLGQGPRRPRTATGRPRAARRRRAARRAGGGLHGRLVRPGPRGQRGQVGEQLLAVGVDHDAAGTACKLREPKRTCRWRCSHL